MSGSAGWSRRSCSRSGSFSSASTSASRGSNRPSAPPPRSWFCSYGFTTRPRLSSMAPNSLMFTPRTTDRGGTRANAPRTEPPVRKTETLPRRNWCSLQGWKEDRFRQCPHDPFDIIGFGLLRQGLHQCVERRLAVGLDGADQQGAPFFVRAGLGLAGPVRGNAVSQADDRRSPLRLPPLPICE